MAQWPADGAENWNVPMLAYLAVGHDTDGTHKKSQMLTDMGWTPTAYAGGESITFPNGLIMKTGRVSKATGESIAFADAFPTSIISINLTGNTQSSGVSVNEKNSTTASITVYHNRGTAMIINWTAYGY